VEENIPSLDFLGTRCSSPSCRPCCPIFEEPWAQARGMNSDHLPAAASHESSNAHTKEDELLVELPPSEEEITVEGSVAEINRIAGMALGTGETGALACIALERCAGRRWFVDEETNGMLITSS
jgi:hypothetical protein